MRAVHMPAGTVVHVAPEHTAACGARVHPNRAGHPIEVDTSRPLATNPAGRPLRWCGKCLGVLAVEAGHAEALAELAGVR